MRRRRVSPASEFTAMSHVSRRKLLMSGSAATALATLAAPSVLRVQGLPELR